MYCYECMNEIKDGSKHCGYCGKSTEINVHPHHLKPGTILHNQYLVGNSIGEGGFGITYVGKDLSLDMKIAIKEYYPSGYANRNNTVSNNVTLNYQNEGSYFQNGVEHFLREAKSIAKFHNERGIVDVRAFFEENDTAYIIMEYLDGENLSDKIRSGEKYEASEIFRLFLPMMNTLEKMHRENIIHRDISPENIRINPNGELTLMDFGSARYYSGMEKKTMSVQFKPGYAPFEQYNKNGNQGPWTDVYGLCATIYKCITGVTPVDSLERSQNDSLELPSSLGVKISEPLEKVLMYGMAIYPENRCPDMRELKSITEEALDNGTPSFTKTGANVLPVGVVSTKAADEKYQTMFADRTYGDTNMYSNASERDFQNNQRDFQNYDRPRNMYDHPRDSYNEMRRYPPKKSNGGLIALVVILSVLLVAGIGALLFFFLGGAGGCDNNIVETTTAVVTTNPSPTEPSGDYVTVPNVVGLDSELAFKELRSKDLEWDSKYEDSDTVPEGEIISQDPVKGIKVKKGDTVKLIVSNGPKPVVTDPPANSSSSSSSSLPEHSDANPDPYTGSINDPFDYYLVGASYRYISEDDISWMTLDQLQLCMNEIYARHGYKFDEGYNHSHFYAIDEYNPDHDDMKTTEKRFNRYEDANLKVMGNLREKLRKLDN